MSFKQKLLHEHGPFPFEFQAQRQMVFNKILSLIASHDKNYWISSGLNLASYIQSYKLIYGLTSLQKQTLLYAFINVLMCDQGTSVHIKILTLRLLNHIESFQIQITPNFQINNFQFLRYFQKMANQGTKIPLKHVDSYMQELSKFVVQFSRYGQECIQPAINLAIQKRQLKFLALFIKSTKNKNTAQKVMEEIFAENSVWDRDISWFYIINQITNKFPHLDYSAYYHTFFQQIIKTFTTLIDPVAEEDVKRIIQKDFCLGIRCILKSVADIMVNLILPSHMIHSNYIWSCIQRVFNIIITSLDHVNEPLFIGDFFLFLKTFTKTFLYRYRKEENLHKAINEDHIEEYSDNQQFIIKMDKDILNKFQELWPQIIPKLLLFEESQCRLPKILSDLIVYKKSIFLVPVLRSILQVLSKQDLSMISLFTPKMTILFVEEFIISQGTEQQLSLLIQCCKSLLDTVYKLGVSQNLDILELIIKVFMYLKQQTINSSPAQSLIDDIIDIIINNLQTMSIALESAESQQAQIYIDFRNIYFPFFLVLDSNQIASFTQKFIYKLVSVVPIHRQAYQLITIILGFINKDFAAKVFKHIFKEIIAPVTTLQQDQKLMPFLPRIKYSLTTTNQQHLKWYSMLIQCCYQYHPDNIVRDWQKLETVIILFIRQWQNNTLVQLGLDVLYNLICCLCQIHIDPKEFLKAKNNRYQSLQVNWNNISIQSKKLIHEIYKKYYIETQKYLLQRYQHIKLDDINDSIKVGNTIVSGYVSLLLDGILIPQVLIPQAVQEKKIISKILSIQQTIFSSLLSRLPPRQDSPLCLSPNFQQMFFSEYKNLRKECCGYLQWLLKILIKLDYVWSPPLMKVFHYFWKEVHEQAPFSSAISATTDKLSPYYYPQQHKRKQLFHSAFLIINQVYLVHYSRLQFHNQLYPLSLTNNPNYLQKFYIFEISLHLELQNILRGYISEQINTHQFHSMIIALFRLKLDPNEPNSYARKYIEAKQTTEKEKYLTAIRLLLNSVKKCQYFFSLQCCIRDGFIRESVLNILSLFKVLDNKKDKVNLLEIFFLKLNFNLELSLLFQQPKYYFWSSNQNNQFALLSNKQLILQMCHKMLRNHSNGINNLEKIKKNNEEKIQQIQKFLTTLLSKLDQSPIDKDAAVYMLFIALYSTVLNLRDPILSKTMLISLKLCETGVVELVDIGRVVFFHITYRFAKAKEQIKKIPNTPKKRPYDKYLTLRLLGGPDNLDYRKIKCQRLDSYFYPLRQLVETTYHKLDQEKNQSNINQRILLDIFNNYEKMLNFFKACTSDQQLKTFQTQTDMSLAQDQSKGIILNGHKLLNYILDANPQKIDIFQTFVQNFSGYPVFFYQRMVEKMIRLGNKQTVKTLKLISKNLRKQTQVEWHKLSLYIGSQIIPSLLQDKQYIDQYLEYISLCSNQVFVFALNCLYFLFCTNFLISTHIYRSLILRLRQQKGSSRLRHLQVFNTYMLAQGRFARDQAKQAIGYLLKGIQQGTDQIAEAIVTMIVSCFIIAINLDTFQDWVQEPIYEIVEQSRIYKLNERVGFEIDPSLRTIIKQIISKAQKQESILSKNLKIYSKIANKILGSITVHRFNDTFYDVLKDLIMYVVNKSIDQVVTDQEIISQLKNSQYPINIYFHLVKSLTDMEGNPQTVVKKKLKYLEGIVINSSYVWNRVELPQIVLEEKSINLDHITALSNMARIMTPIQLTQAVQEALKRPQTNIMKDKLLMAYLLAAGVRSYQWKQQALKEILKNKKKKIVKQFISVWWKGKGQGTQQERRLYRLVRNVENPYSYFA